MDVIPDRINRRGVGLIGFHCILLGIGLSSAAQEDSPLIWWLPHWMDTTAWVAAGVFALVEALRPTERRWVWWVIALPFLARIFALVAEIWLPGEPDLDNIIGPVYTNVGRLIIIGAFAGIPNWITEHGQYPSRGVDEEPHQDGA